MLLWRAWDVEVRRRAGRGAGPLWPQRHCHGDQRDAMGDELGFDQQVGGREQRMGLRMVAFPAAGAAGQPRGDVSATW